MEQEICAENAKQFTPRPNMLARCKKSALRKKTARLEVFGKQVSSSAGFVEN